MDLNLPPNIENYAKIVSDLQRKDRLTGEQKKKLAMCKLKIALWACKAEGMPITRYSISEVLGPDTFFVFNNAQNLMMEIEWESPEDRAAMRALAMSGRRPSSSGGGKSSAKGGGKKPGGMGTYS